ncbi:MAG TPA: hypothetical protein VJ883_09410 [Woeseiaceae bacterium]|nr:hypothetical protein [Woeseiaceae bacterium]
MLTAQARGQAIRRPAHPFAFVVIEFGGVVGRRPALLGQTSLPAHGIGATVVRTPYPFCSTLLDTADLLVGLGDDGGTTALAGADGITHSLLGL